MESKSTTMDLKYDLGSKPSLKQLVYENLQRMIIHGELRPGSRLTEDELSQAMNISRAPIREALNMLERDGFARIIPRKGAIVAEVTRKDVTDIWKCRMALEPFAARESLPNIPRKKAEQALKNLIELEKEPDCFEKYIASDLEVHELLYKYLDNSYMQSILENLKAHSVRMRWLQENKQTVPECNLTSIREHRIIVDAILSGDGEQLYQAVLHHIANSENRVGDSVE